MERKDSVIDEEKEKYPPIFNTLEHSKNKKIVFGKKRKL